MKKNWLVYQYNSATKGRIDTHSNNHAPCGKFWNLFLLCCNIKSDQWNKTYQWSHLGSEHFYSLWISQNSSELVHLSEAWTVQKSIMIFACPRCYVGLGQNLHTIFPKVTVNRSEEVRGRRALESHSATYNKLP